MNKLSDLNEPAVPDSDGTGEPRPEIRALRAPRAPQHDLWPGIEARLAPRQRRGGRWQQPVWLAAAGVAGVSLLTAVMLSQRPHRSLGGEAASLHAPAEVVAATLPTQAASIQAVAIVRPVHTESRALIRANLKLVNNAEVQVRKAMQSDPDAAYLQSLLATAHQQKKSLQVALSDDGE